MCHTRYVLRCYSPRYETDPERLGAADVDRDVGLQWRRNMSLCTLRWVGLQGLEPRPLQQPTALCPSERQIQGAVYRKVVAFDAAPSSNKDTQWYVSRERQLPSELDYSC